MSRLALAAALALCGAWHLALRAHGRGIPLITDEGEYAVAARVWAEGGLPYRDAFSQKPPTVLALYRAAAALSRSPAAPRALAAAAGLLVLLALWLAAPREWSAAARLAGPAAFAALGALPVGDYGFTANTEVFVNAFSALSALALLRGAAFAAGLAAGAALTAKQTALWTVLGFGALSAWTPSGLDARRGARFLAGAALVPAAWAAYFAARGAFGAYWDGAWAGNLRYAAALAMTGALAGQLSWFARVLAPRLALLSAPALALAFLGLRGLEAGPRRPVETLAVVWLGAAAAGALTGLFLFPHYFLALAPALALAAAAGVERLPARARAGAAVLLALWPALLAPRLLFASPPRERALALLYPNPLFETRVLGDEIARRAESGDRLHVFGSEGALFVYSGLEPATPRTLCYALTLFPKGDAGWQEEMRALYAAPPRFVVWSGQPLSTLIAAAPGERYRGSLKTFLEREYRLAGWVRVTDAPELPVFERASPTGRPRWDAEDRLWLFERRSSAARPRDEDVYWKK